MSAELYNGYRATRPRKSVVLFAVFMGFVALLMIVLGGGILLSFSKGPHSETVLLSYVSAAVQEAAKPRADIDSLYVELFERVYFYLAALRCALWTLIGGGVCLLSVCFVILRMQKRQ